MDQLLDIQAAARFLAVSPRTVRNYMRIALLPFYRLAGRTVRFRESDLHAWLNRQRANNPSPQLIAENLIRSVRADQRKHRPS